MGKSLEIQACTINIENEKECQQFYWVMVTGRYDEINLHCLLKETHPYPFSNNKYNLL